MKSVVNQNLMRAIDAANKHTARSGNELKCASAYSDANDDHRRPVVDESTPCQTHTEHADTYARGRERMTIAPEVRARIILKLYAARLAAVNPYTDQRKWKKICADEYENARTAAQIYLEKQFGELK